MFIIASSGIQRTEAIAHNVCDIHINITLTGRIFENQAWHRKAYLKTPSKYPINPIKPHCLLVLYYDH